MLVNFADLSAAQKLTIGLVIMDEKVTVAHANKSFGVPQK